MQVIIIPVHLKKLNMEKKFIFSSNLFKKVKLSSILDLDFRCKVKHLKRFFGLILMIRAYS